MQVRPKPLEMKLRQRRNVRQCAVCTVYPVIWCVSCGDVLWARVGGPSSAIERLLPCTKVNLQTKTKRPPTRGGYMGEMRDLIAVQETASDVSIVVVVESEGGRFQV